MGDIRKENSFIECGFKLFEQLKEPARPGQMSGMLDFYLEQLYFGHWTREKFNIGYDDDFELLGFEPDFRLYYAIAGLNGVCAGWAGHIPYFAEYLRDIALEDAATTKNQNASLGIRAVLNSLLLIHPSKLDYAQNLLIEVLLEHNMVTEDNPTKNASHFHFDEHIIELGHDYRTTINLTHRMNLPNGFILDPGSLHEWFYSYISTEMPTVQLSGPITGTSDMLNASGDCFGRELTGQIVTLSYELPQVSENDNLTIVVGTTNPGGGVMLTHSFSVKREILSEEYAETWSKMLENYEKCAIQSFPNDTD